MTLVVRGTLFCWRDPAFALTGFGGQRGGMGDMENGRMGFFRIMQAASGTLVLRDTLFCCGDPAYALMGFGGQRR